MIKSAIIDGQFRYLLSREWDTRIPRRVCFVMLNPSTADGDQDDNTVRKCIAFARIHEFGALDIVNLYAFRTKSPDVLARHGYPVGPDNDKFIARAIMHPGVALIIAAWGARARGSVRVPEVMQIIKDSGKPVKAIKLLKDGTPSHPLMLAYKLPLVNLPSMPELF